MKTKVVVVSGIMAVLEIISVAAGFAAEATRIKASEVHVSPYFEDLKCVHPSSPALGLGIGALVSAVITRIILLIVVGCCYRPSNSTSTPIFVVYILSWIASVVAVILFFGGVLLSSRQYAQQEHINGRLTCYVVKRGIFAAGATLSIFSTVFGIVAYIYVSSSMQTTSLLHIELPVAGDVDVEKNQVHRQQ